MKRILDFFILANKLNNVKRTGWVLLNVKNPETIGEHILRVAIVSWLLGRKHHLNTKKIIKIALFHDLCEVYAGDVTPFSYYLKIPKNKEDRDSFLKKWVRLPLKEKKKRSHEKFKKEKNSLLRLIRFLPTETKRDIFSSWLSYEQRSAKVGNFVRQIDRIEVLLQSIEYFGTNETVGGTSWWEGTEEMIDDPLLVELLHFIQVFFYKKPAQRKDENNLQGALKFASETGSLKKIPREGWILRGIKNPETVGSHIFLLSLMTWVLSKESKLNLNEEKLLKMVLCCSLHKVHAGDKAPYSKILKGKSAQEKRRILSKWIRLSKKEKAESFIDDYKEGLRAVKKLVKPLDVFLQREILQLWDEYMNLSSLEGRFLHQVEIAANLLVALQYAEKDKNFPIEGFWEWAFETVDDVLILKFMEELKKRFHKKKFVFTPQSIASLAQQYFRYLQR